MTDYILTINGTADLLMHNQQLSDPLNEWVRQAKKVSSKMKKTEDDHLFLAEMEFQGGLYFNEDTGPYLPSDNIRRCLHDAAKRHKLGVKLNEGLLVDPTPVALRYNGPRTREGLWADENFRHRASAIVNRARIMRTRPMFREWGTAAILQVDPSILDMDELQKIVDTAQRQIGLGDWRPRYGTFEATLAVAK